MSSRELKKLPFLLFADHEGRLYDHPRLRMAGFSGPSPWPLDKTDLIPLPEFSKIFFLPGCRPIGIDPETGKYVTIHEAEIEGTRDRVLRRCRLPGTGVRAHPPACGGLRAEDRHPAHVGLLGRGLPRRPILGPGVQIEYNPRWDPRNYDDRKLVPAIKRYVKRSGEGLLTKHLIGCATSNHCFAAKNLFLRRWEAPLPVSRKCNARCLGCLSLQPGDSCAASHHRIAFRPQKEEIVALAVEHLETAPEAIVSFGQGCEGEPLTEYRLIAESIRDIRKRTSKGTINLNTNGSWPERIRAIAEQGLDSIRISMNSARPELYRAYYRPKGYDFEDVVRSISLSREMGLYTMVNYLIFPGVSDQEEEMEALVSLVNRTGLNFLHLKNLNIDPQLYLREMPTERSKPLGMKRMVEFLRKECPELELGYFNKAVR